VQKALNKFFTFSFQSLRIQKCSTKPQIKKTYKVDIWSKSMHADSMLLDLLPRIVELGDYSMQVRDSIVSWKKDPNDFDDISNLVTEVDVYVQEGILKCLLEKGYKGRVLAEEETPSLKRFTETGDITIVIDPIDGTLAYKLGLDNFCIIVSRFRNNSLQSTLVHTPTDRKTYFADLEGCQVIENGERQRNPLIIPDRMRLLALTYSLDNETENALRTKGIIVHQLNRDGKADPKIEINSILKGGVGAYFIRNASFFDWAPIGFIVQKAGGIVTDYSGRQMDFTKFIQHPRIPQEFVLSTMIVSLDEKIHRILVENLSK